MVCSFIHHHSASVSTVCIILKTIIVLADNPPRLAAKRLGFSAVSTFLRKQRANKNWQTVGSGEQENVCNKSFNRIGTIIFL